MLSALPRCNSQRDSKSFRVSGLLFLEIWILEDEDRFYAEGFKFDCEMKGFGWGDFEFSNGDILVAGKFLRLR